MLRHCLPQRLVRNLCIVLQQQQLACSSSYSTTTNAATATAANTNNNPLASVSYGQPTALTHPHLINEHELVPGLTLQEFQQRRQRLMYYIQKYARDNTNDKTENQCHLVIIPAASKKYMSDKIPYVFRQNSDFYYYTGCLEPDSVLVLHIDKQEQIKSLLFMRPKDKHAELWDGTRTGVDAALQLFGVEEAYELNRFKQQLQKLHDATSPAKVWYDAYKSDYSYLTQQINDVIGTACSSPIDIVHGMRLYKSPAEQQLMRRTCQIASEAINETMRETRAGHSEHHIFAMMDYKCRMRNASYLAYPPVVAAGTNATTIHYVTNNQLTKTGDLVLMDAGCEYGGYTSDVTRTWPVSGSFTAPQKVLYDIVLTVQLELMQCLQKEGGETLDNLFDTMCIKLGKYLQEAGLVPKGFTEDRSYAKAGYHFCPHHVSHYLGMDVHDTPTVSRSLPLQTGMTFTVEPGIYIDQHRADVPPEFRGLGIRIEDNVLITENGFEVLTGSCLKERADIENLFKSK